MVETPFLRMENIHKRFGDVVANAGVNLDVEEGEIHTLLGENGAGKSVLMNILAGVLTPNEGRTLLRGKQIQPGGHVMRQFGSGQFPKRKEAALMS